MNNMDESMGTIDEPVGSSTGGGSLTKAAINRRTMLKAAVATGVVAGTWVAPRIESLGFAPAAAAGTPCVILSPEADDKNSQSGQNYCPIPAPKPCCGQSFGNAGQIDRFTFLNPAPNCSQIVVRTIALNCNTANTQPERNPDVGQFAVIIESTSGTGCGACRILDAVIIDSSGRQVQGAPLNNGPFACGSIPGPNPVGDGVDASIACNDPRLTSDSRLAVRLTCIVEVGGCDPTATTTTTN